MKVGLFIPCYIDQFYPQVAIASLELLEKLGCTVGYPTDQTCCGQPMANSGFHYLSGGCESNFISNFSGYDYIVSPSGSCVLHIKEHIQSFALKIYELTEFLTDVLEVESLQAYFPYRVGVHPGCHGQRGLGLSSMSEVSGPGFSKPEYLLRMVSGIELSAALRQDECCGFGGTFCVFEEAVSVKMGQDRIRDHELNQVDYITAGDTSCLMHLDGILRRRRSKIKTIHIAEILNRN